jgi:GxxExxY protein
MNADKRRWSSEELAQLTHTIIGAAHTVSNALGAGFLEKIYENALAIELRKSNIKVKKQHDIQVIYSDEVVGEFKADLLVEDIVIVELKAVNVLDQLHQAQCMNYLRATGLTICLLINFGRPRLEVKRIVRQYLE